MNNISGWWFQPTPLKNMSQLGVVHSQLFLESHEKKIHGSKPPNSLWVDFYPRTNHQPTIICQLYPLIYIFPMDPSTFLGSTWGMI